MMRRKKQLRFMLPVAVVLPAVLPAVNILADPVFRWDSYNETNHPQTAKPACPRACTPCAAGTSRTECPLRTFRKWWADNNPPDAEAAAHFAPPFFF